MSEDILLHFTSSPGFSTRHATNNQELGPKPTGLWLSDGMAWREWCEGEDFRLHAVQYATRIYLSEHANILRLDTVEKIDRFTREYQGHSFRELRDWRIGRIDWGNVAQHYDGILIMPYQDTVRFSECAMWYYGWDCSSGCIWNMKAIARCEPYYVGQSEQQDTEQASTALRKTNLD